MSRCERSGAISPGLSPLVGDPVHVVTGSVIDVETDFRIQREGLRFSWVRYYDSARREQQRGVGRGMRHVLDYALAYDLDGLTLTLPDGEEQTFAFLGDGKPQAQSGRFSLAKTADTREYVVSDGRDVRLVFHFGQDLLEPAQLVAARLLDTELRLAYAGGRLSSVSFPDSSALLYHWGGEHLRRIDYFAPDYEKLRFLSYDYDSEDRLVRVTDPYHLHQHYAYDAFHRLTRKTDRRGYSFLFAYDRDHRCVRTEGEDGAQRFDFTYKPLECTTEVRRVDGGLSTYFYDPLGTILTVVEPSGGARSARLDEEGRVVAELDALGNETRLVYDGRGELAAKVDPLGHVLPASEDDDDDEPPHPLAHWVGECPQHWLLGRHFPISETLPVRGETLWRVPPGTRDAIRTSSHGWPLQRRMVRDLQGLPIREEHEDGTRRRYAFDPNANLRWVIDFSGRRTDFTYVSENLLSTVRDPLGRTTRFEYSPYEKVTAFVDAGGTRSEYAYDTQDRLIEVRRHGRVRERYAYDQAGNLIEKRDGRDELIFRASYGRGNLERSRTWADGRTERFEYDEAGRLTLASSDDGTCSFAYSPDGTRTADLRDGRGVEHRCIGGALTATTVLGRYTTRYRALDEDRTEIIDPTGRRHVLARLTNGVYELALANGATEVTQFDPFGRCLSKTVLKTQTGAVLRQRRYTYNADGDLLAIDSDRDGRTVIEHDAAHRLAAVVHPHGQVDRYEYDEADNLVRMPGLAQELLRNPHAEADAAPVVIASGNRLHRARGELFHYDERNHVVRRESAFVARTYVRDSADQLRQIFVGGALELEASYDALGRRVEKRTGPGAWTYFWDTDRLAAERFPDGRLRVYVYASADALVPILCVDYASAEAAPEDGRVYSLHADHLGTIDWVLDGERQTVWRARLDPYGTAHVDVGSAFHQPLRMPGHYHDGESGLFYNRFRYYDPAIARYLECDPLGIEGGDNLYAYTGNPLREVDVRGLQKDCPEGLTAKLARWLRRKRKRQESRPGGESDPSGTEGISQAERRDVRRELGKQRGDPAPSLMDASALARARLAQQEAQQLHNYYPKNEQGHRCVAVNGIRAQNGQAKAQPSWADERPKHLSAPSMIARTESLELPAEIKKQILAAHRSDQEYRGGTNASHAERLVAVHHEVQETQHGPSASQPVVGISRESCGLCRYWLRAHSEQTGVTHVVADPAFTRVYHPDGTVDIHNSEGDLVARVEPGTKPEATRNSYKGIPW